ncbi:hypothetical protein LCGC14_1124680 [marine sediment metagenome]|uniref:Uncharacterized protein n=1 Tax=marine sediment metagenome TaxID=412755 RepID=A0A0F9N2Y9_9ZZZZ
MSIKAECHSDDRVREASFDAAPYFVQASAESIGALAECGWGGDYPADYVAQFMAEHNKEVRLMFKYLDLVSDKKDAPGFECHVDEADAMAWLKENRKALALTLEMGKKEK